MADDHSPASTPRWALALVGFVAAMAVLEARDPPVPPEAARLLAAPPPPLDPARMSPRALRALPGIGQVLALAIDRARLAHGGRREALGWQDVRGIGPATEEKVTAWFRARGRDAPAIVPAAAGR